MPTIPNVQGRWQWYSRYGHEHTNFWGRKIWMASLGLPVHYGVASSSSLLSKLWRSLPWTFSSLQTSKVATRGLRPSQIFMAIFEHVRQSFQEARFNHFTSCRNYRWEDSLWPKHDLRSYLRVPNFKNLSGGACPQTPLFVSTYALLIHHHNGRTNLK